MAATDDDKDNVMSIANPDSFLNNDNSIQNFQTNKAAPGDQSGNA